MSQIEAQTVKITFSAASFICRLSISSNFDRYWQKAVSQRKLGGQHLTNCFRDSENSGSPKSIGLYGYKSNLCRPAVLFQAIVRGKSRPMSSAISFRLLAIFVSYSKNATTPKRPRTEQ